MRLNLPITDVLPELADRLTSSTRVVLTAPPGAGKTTAVPAALLNESWMSGKRILMLEPRRIAARRAAEYISTTLGTKPGSLVGYRIRGEVRVSAETRIEIVTEGILSRMLLTDQDLPHVGLVIFDEFHERSIHADLGLAFALDLQRHLRPDLRILVMSATLDVSAVSRLMNDAPVIESTGRLHPVNTRHASFTSNSPLERRMAETIVRAMSQEDGDILAFLPGIREIRRTEEELLKKGQMEGIVIHQLYGDAPRERQRAALEPDPGGRRKIILSTSLAETSVTIDGVRIVVDSGLARTLRYDARRGMSSLVTVPVSKAIAEQRKGRAGRQAPGACCRLWRIEDHEALPDQPVPEIKATDLAQVAIQLAVWGDPYAEGLSLLDPPPRANLEQARRLLRDLGALNDSGSLTSHGKAIAEFPVHPRFAHMILVAARHGLGSLACDLSAILEERETASWPSQARAGSKFSGVDVDASHRWLSYRQTLSGRGRSPSDSWVAQRIRAQAERYRMLAGVVVESGREDDMGRLLGLAFPDRVGRRRGTDSRYILTGGQTAKLPDLSPMGKHEYLAVGFLEGSGTDAVILLASPLTTEDVEFLAKGRTEQKSIVRWDERREEVEAREVRRLGAVILDERGLDADHPSVAPAMLEGVRKMGLASLPWTKESEARIARSEWVRARGLGVTDWPVISREELEGRLRDWLLPHLGGMTKRSHLQKLNLDKILDGLFTRQQVRTLDALAPSHVVVPSGSRIPVDYASPDSPRIEVKLQEMFGLGESPLLGGGRIPVTVHLLSPARRPLAVTRDLASFWRTTYREIRAQMRAKYPRHPWPEDPWTAKATKRTTRKKKS